MKKRLLIIMGSLNRGGAERVISLIANDFVSRGWEVWIGLLIYNSVEYKLHEEIHIIDLTGGKGSRVKKGPAWLKDIRQLTKKIRPDEILSFAARMNVLTQIACIGLNSSITVSERNDPYMDGRNKILDFLTFFLYPKAKNVVFQTQRAASYFQRISLKNSIVIPNPISVTTYATQMKSGKIVAVGRLEPQKNHEMLIKAFSHIVDSFPQATLTIYGRGYLEEELKKLVKELNMDGKVLFPGNIENIHEMIADANVFVLSSNYEGLSNALLEAMMMGLPCISTDCAGADEYINNNENGILIKVGDEQGLLNEMKRILNNPEDAARMGKQAHNTSKSFEKDVILERWYKTITRE
ncbi:glycosyltransferase family 4 protein [Clostridiales bacterium FE2011]|nr:glycosyltransferase family 4 protein [Clostridiales bacterium FE2011]